VLKNRNHRLKNVLREFDEAARDKIAKNAIDKSSKIGVFELNLYPVRLTGLETCEFKPEGRLFL